jgi:predicted DNA-binding protein (UPF0251 family)
MAKPKMYTITEAARKLGVTRQTLHGAISKGRLEADWGEVTQTVKVKALLIPEPALETYQQLYSRKRRTKK